MERYQVDACRAQASEASTGVEYKRNGIIFFTIIGFILTSVDGSNLNLNMSAYFKYEPQHVSLFLT